MRNSVFFPDAQFLGTICFFLNKIQNSHLNDQTKSFFTEKNKAKTNSLRQSKKKSTFRVDGRE